MTKAYIAGFLDKCAECAPCAGMPEKEANAYRRVVNFIGRLAGSRGTLSRLEGMLAKARTSRPAVVPRIESWIAQERAAVKDARRNALIGGALALPMVGMNAMRDGDEPRWRSYNYETYD